MTTLLIDADIVAFRSAAAAEQKIDWEDGEGPQYASDEQYCIDTAHGLIHEYVAELQADDVLLCFSDVENWRKRLWRGYKAHRTARRPELLEAVKISLANGYANLTYRGCEGDDVIGIQATSGRYPCVIVSEDKDLLTIPGRVWNPRYPDRGVRYITRREAHCWHMTQTLIGDTTDGYPGCRGIGPKSKFVALLQDAEPEEMWDIVVEAFQSKGKTEDDALLQARLAYILWAADWDGQSPRLWDPKFLIR